MAFITFMLGSVAFSEELPAFVRLGAGALSVVMAGATFAGLPAIVSNYREFQRAVRDLRLLKGRP